MTSQDMLLANVYQYLLKVNTAMAHEYKCKTKPISWFLISY